MGNAIVDDTKRILSEADLPPYCPKCKGKEMFVSYAREFIVDLDKEASEEAIGSGMDPYNITCYECGKLIWEE